MFAMARMPDARAKVIEDALFQFDLSIRWLAEKIGRSHVAVSEWLKGTAKPQKQEVWNQMLDALQEYEAGLTTSGNIKIRATRRLTIPVLPFTVDVMDTETRASGVYSDTVDIDPPEDDRKVWTRRVTDRKVSGCAEPNDVLVFDQRDAEPGHIVDAFYNGRSIIRVLCGSSAAPKLMTTDGQNPEVISEGFVVRGVAWQKVEDLGRGIKRRTTYEFGIYHE